MRSTLSTSGKQAPSVSFVLATYNRGPVLMDCLKRILSCGLPAAQFTITVIDNASSDQTPALVRQFALEHAGRVRYVRLEKNCGPVAKNIGLYQNNADILVILDDDAYPMPGAIFQAIRHFQDDPHLGAAVFDVVLPDGAKEASAYPDVFIGAGTAFRREALEDATSGAAAMLPGRGLLPADFFMQAEEYDLSFRLLAAGWSIQRFEDMPLMHLKSPGARIATRTTRLDVRNNLWLLARYLPEPICHELAADWLARYWRMAARRDLADGGEGRKSRHRAAFLRGAAEGLKQWKRQRGDEAHILEPSVIERIFKLDAIAAAMARLRDTHGWKRIAFADWGKNMLGYWKAARQVGLEIAVIVDGNLAAQGRESVVDYRGIPVINESRILTSFVSGVDGLIVTAMSSVHAARRQSALQRVWTAAGAGGLPIVDLFAKSSAKLPLGAGQTAGT